MDADPPSDVSHHTSANVLVPMNPSSHSNRVPRGSSTQHRFPQVFKSTGESLQSSNAHISAAVDRIGTLQVAVDLENNKEFLEIFINVQIYK